MVTKNRKRLIYKVIGVGGAGLNTITALVDESLIKRADCIGVDTSSSDLRRAKTAVKICVRKFNGGLSKGVATKLRQCLSGAEKVYLVAGLGGVATDLMPLVASEARGAGVLVTGYVFSPFDYEGKRVAKARQGIPHIQKHVAKLIIFPMERLFKMCDGKTPVAKAFRMAENGLKELINRENSYNKNP